MISNSYICHLGLKHAFVEATQQAVCRGTVGIGVKVTSKAEDVQGVALLAISNFILPYFMSLACTYLFTFYAVVHPPSLG